LAFVYDVSLYRTLKTGFPDAVILGHPASFYGSFGGEGAVDLGIFALLGVVGGEKERRVCLEGVEALAATAVLSRAMKLLVREERPAADPNHKHYFADLRADSFPSGHTMSAFATAAVIAGEYPALAPLVYGIATYVGIARIQERTHWPSDVLVGGLLGYLLGREAVAIHTRVRVAPVFSGDSKGIELGMTMP
jgi:membrane-associated phospholipid phosphatase